MWRAIEAVGGVGDVGDAGGAGGAGGGHCSGGKQTTPGAAASSKVVREELVDGEVDGWMDLVRSTFLENAAFIIC